MMNSQPQDNIKSDGILLVDDEISNNLAIKEVLKYSGYTNIHTASDGTEALSLLASLEDNISVIILDIRMPGLDGFGVLKHLTNVHVYPVSIVMLTAYGDPESRRQFFSMGNDTVLTTQFLSKPTKQKELIEEVENALRCVRKKRDLTRQANAGIIAREISEMKIALDIIRTEVRELSNKHRSFVAELGMDVIRAILIAVAFIALLYFGVGDFLRSILPK